jgi:hypothetical protein
MNEAADYDGAWKEALEIYLRPFLERGYERKDILELFRLIDWLLTLPDQLAVAFREDLINLKGRKLCLPASKAKSAPSQRKDWRASARRCSISAPCKSWKPG